MGRESEEKARKKRGEKAGKLRKNKGVGRSALESAIPWLPRME
jgi:hypothetical protein